MNHEMLDRRMRFSLRPLESLRIEESKRGHCALIKSRMSPYCFLPLLLSNLPASILLALEL